MNELRYATYRTADAVSSFFRSRLLHGSVVTLLAVVAMGSVTGIGGNIAAAGIAAAGLCALVYMYPPAAAWAMVGIAPFIIGFARGQFLPNMRLNEAMFVILLAGLGLHALVYRGSIRPKVNRFDVATLLLMAFGSVIPLVIQFGRLRGVTGGDILYALAPIKFTLAYVICRLAIRNRRELDLTVKVALIAASIVSLVAVADSMNIGGFAILLSNYVPSGEVIIDDGRGGSTFGNPIGMGVYATICALLALAYISTGRGGPVMMRIAFACCVAGVIGSGQITGIIALAAGTAAFVWVNGGMFALARRLLPMLLVALVVLWPLVAQRVDGFDGFEVSSEARRGVEQSVLPRDQPRALWELNPGSSWDYRLYNLETYFFPEFEDTNNIYWGVQNEARLEAPDDFREFIWIEAGYVWLLWIGGIPYVLAFVLYVAVGMREHWKAARAHRRNGRAASVFDKIAGVGFSSVAILFVVQAFDPHLTLRGTADILFPLLGCIGFMLQPLDFWHGTALSPDTVRHADARHTEVEPAYSGA